MKYFENFPTIYYSFDSSNFQFKEVVDIFTRVKMLDSIINNIAVYYEYQMKDSDSVESIAYKYYGDANRHWIILFTNLILDPYFELPVKLDVLNQKIEANYGTIANAMSTVHHVEKRINVTTTTGLNRTEQVYVSYIPNNCIEVDGVSALPNTSNPVIQLGSTSTTLADGSVTTSDVELVAISNFDYEVAMNESRRNIKLVNKEYVPQIENELRRFLSL